MKNKPLVIYLLLISLFSAGFIVIMKILGQKGNYLAALYMLFPAIAAIITRSFFYEKKFSDANLKFGKLKVYFKYWGIALGITAISVLFYTVFRSVDWDFSGQTFLNQLSEQFSLSGRDINTLPEGFTPQMMLWLYFIGGLTIFNILPGIITGFGEEFGWRGLMFPLMYKIKPLVAFIIGGLIWYAWHIPLVLVFPEAQDFGILQMVVNIIILLLGSIFTFTFLAYVYVKSENIFVVSLAHITMNNAARSFGYFAIVRSQTLANLGLTVTMLIVICIIYFSKEWQVFHEFFNKKTGE